MKKHNDLFLKTRKSRRQPAWGGNMIQFEVKTEYDVCSDDDHGDRHLLNWWMDGWMIHWFIFDVFIIRSFTKSKIATQEKTKRKKKNEMRNAKKKTSAIKEWSFFLYSWRIKTMMTWLLLNRWHNYVTIISWHHGVDQMTQFGLDGIMKMMRWLHDD